MPGELIRPGVEVLQTFPTASPSFVRPTLAPCIVGPAFEVTPVLNSDGTVNSNAKYGSYLQIGKTITQSSFPAPRNNVDELDFLEETIRPFMVAGGKLNELLMNPGESFLATSHGASRAAIQTVAFGGGIALDGKVLVLQIDNPVRLDLSEDITITFVGTLTAAQAAAQINTAVGSAVATVVNSDHVQIASLKYGALSSVTVRKGASANPLLTIGYDGGVHQEERVEGSGYRGQDDNDNDTVTPWIEFYRGDFLVDGASAAFLSKAGLINVETQTFASAKASAVTFGSSGTVPIAAGDYFYADGVKVKSGEVMKVESARFKMGTINAALSTANDNGRYTSKVYDTAEVATLFDADPFAPKYAYFVATGLDDATAVPTAAAVTGTTAGAAATAATVEGTGAPAGPFALTGLTLIYSLTVNGVVTEGTFTFTNSYANMGLVAAAISISGLTASNNAGNLHLATTLSGRLQAFTLKSTGTANGVLGFSTSVDTSDTGSDVEFLDIPPVITGNANQTFAFSYTSGETLVIESSNDGGSTWAALTRTFTFPASTTAANIAALLAVLNTAGSWNGGTLPVNFVISNNGNKLVITGVTGGSLQGLRIGAASTAIGVTTNSDLLFTGNQNDIGEENLNGQSLSFTFDSNPHIYTVAFTTDSLDVSVSEINTAVGATVATKSGSDKLKLTSPLKGAASKVVVTAGKAATAFGLSTSPASGTARPFPDAFLDDSNNLVVGSQILRDRVTGYPLDFTNDFGTLYIQYKALRKDVTAVARVAGVLHIPDVDTLGTVLSPLTEENPLGLALFLCMLNCPTFEVKGLGVDEVTGAAPEGTALAYARAAAMLETEEVYAIAPLTQDEVITGLWRTHCVAMSEPEQAGERIVFFNHITPVRANPGIAASGTQANSTATTNQMLLDVNPSPGLVDLGLNPADPFVADDGVYMEFEVSGELRRYNVSSVSGALANFRVTFAAGENDDGFYTTTALTESVINASWALKVRGDSLIIPGSNPERLDYSLVANNVADANFGIKNRRAYSVFPDTVKTVVNGIEKSLPGYYACAAICGMVAGLPPQQGFTNFPITGLTGVVGPERFSKRQLNIMAGGGTYILVQDVVAGPVSCRHQVSTDLTSIETRELSITKIVDFVAKFMRLGVRKYIGTQNINSDLLDSIGTTVHGMIGFLVEAGVLNGANLNNLVQDEDAPDTVLVDVTLDVPFPCNYIRVTLVV